MSEYLEDLLKDSSESFEDGNYFLVTITELELGEQYPLEFQWKYKDGTVGKDWSAVYVLNVPGATVPDEPNLASGDVVGGAGFIQVTWNGNSAGAVALTNIDRIDVHISGTSFGDGTKPAGSFKKAGTQTFAAEPGIYIVQLRTITVNGAESVYSQARTVTVTSPGITVESPTLPSGLSVATAPFAVTVNWTGQYSTSSFSGFKSIDIYAVSSDLGSSVTSGITSTNLVGSLTVNDTPNKINISLDNLRQALGLSSNSDVYSATIFYYYNATNIDGTKYGSPTYTRINSSSVVPTKANFVDLASGVISIENLVAGNGNFASWLRTGTAGGARIELSAVSDFSNSGYTVQKGLTAYSSGNTEIFKLDLDTGALTINGSGTFSGNLSAAGGTFTGTLSAASGSFSGTITATGGTIGGITIAANGLQNSLGTWDLASSGILRLGSNPYIYISPTLGIYDSAGTFTLSISGTSTIAGWSIGSSAITKGSTTISSSGTNGFIQIGSGSSFFKASSDGIQLGNETFGSAPFRVTPAGALTATNATITGNITANSGTFNGTINATGGTFSGSITASGTISGGTISGATLSGGLIRTGTTGSRILISGSDQVTNPNAITFINPGGSPSAHIVPLNIGGTTYGLLMHEGGTADQTGGTYPQLFVGNGGVTMSARQFLGGPQGLVSVSNSGVSISGTNGADVNVTGPITFSSTMFAPNLSTSTSGTNLRVTTGTVGEIQETSASSIRYKENIQNITLSSELNPNNLLNLPVRSFTYKDGYVSDSDDRYNKVLPGFIAEEVEECYPIAVDYAEGQPHTWNERFIVPGILALVQNLNQELINIKSRLDALEG